jgi:HSP20 family protein
MLSRQDPFSDLLRLQSEVSRWFDDGASPRRLDATRGTAWVPPVDVHEDQERLLFKVDLPEVRREDVTLRVDSGVLTIEGSRKLEFEDRQSGYHRVERVNGKFARSFALPDSVSSDDVKAELKDGVLRITIGKKKEARPRTIEIKAS